MARPSSFGLAVRATTHADGKGGARSHRSTLMAEISARHYGARLRRLLERGHDLVILENELVRVEVAASKGADIISFLHKPTDVDPLWRRRRGLPPLALVSGRPFLDSYEGGWQEVFPNGGPATSIAGASLPVNGEISTIPWSVEVVEDSSDAVEVSLSVRTIQLPFKLTRRMRLESGSTAMSIRERIDNESPVALPFMWGHHPAFGAPFLDASCRVDIGARVGQVSTDADSPSVLVPGSTFEWPVVPTKDGATLNLDLVPRREADTFDRVTLSMDDGWFAITNQSRRVGFGLAWDATVFPIVWYWRLAGGPPTYPWFGSEYAVAIEPWTTSPAVGLAESVAAGTARRLDPFGYLETDLVATLYADRSEVNGLSRSGEIT